MKKLVLIIIAILIIGGASFWALRPHEMVNTQQTKDEALRQAKEYRPEGMCPQAITPAIHEATGAKYTFNNGCLPPGWKAAPRESVSN